METVEERYIYTPYQVSLNLLFFASNLSTQWGVIISNLSIFVSNLSTQHNDILIIIIYPYPYPHPWETHIPVRRRQNRHIPILIA